MKLRYISYQFIVFLLSLILMICDCGKKHNPFEADKVQFPEAPKNIRIFVGDNEVQLSWEIKNPDDILKYFVYRKDSIDTEPSLLDSTNLNNYRDLNLSNGQIYFYQISALSKNRIEGPLSKTVSVIPNIYDLSIENGKDYTNKKDVTLYLTAPAKTKLVKISHDSLFLNSSWEQYAPTKTWQLEGDDGIKHIYAKFRDQYSNETIHLCHDQIILDTKAKIYSLVENSNGDVLMANDVLHISLDSRESEGEASFDLGIMKNIFLYDDGTHGDKVGKNGIYEYDLIIPPKFELENGKVTGYFKDRAGNQADSFSTATNILIQAPPEGVTLYHTPNITFSSVELTWSTSNDQNFKSYQLFRSKNSGVTDNSEFVCLFSEKTENNFVDKELDANTTYYYKIFVNDKFGLKNGSNEISVTTLNNDDPEQVLLAQPGIIDSTTLKITWSQSTDEDFKQYCLFRSEYSPVDTTQPPVAIINDVSTLQYIDSNLKTGVEYFYIMKIFDKDGNSSLSNQVSGKPE